MEKFNDLGPDNANEAPMGVTEFLYRKIQQTFVKAKANVYFDCETVQGTEITVVKDAAFRVEEREIRPDEGKRSAGPNPSIRTDGHHREKLAFAKLTLSVFAEARAGKDTQTRPIKDGGKAIQKPNRVTR